MNFFDFIIQHRAQILALTREHLLLVGVAILIAVLISVPLGILLTRRPALSKPIIGFANIVQTIPSLAIFGFLIPLPLIGGIGARPAIIALVLYSLLPIIRNTYTGIINVDLAVREAGRGMGMTDKQLLWQVELPLALGVILAGVRVATVIAVGVATIAAAVGGGGLGVLILRGVQVLDNNLILAGAVPAALLALVADVALGQIEHWFATADRRRTALWPKITAAVIAGLILLLFTYSPAATNRIVIGSKNFTESIILGELLTQAIARRTGLPVEHRANLGSTFICHQALTTGQIDGYVEYTGTALTAVLKQAPNNDPAAVYRQVQTAYAEQFDITVTEPLGFNNTFAMIVRGEVARRLNLQTISQAAAYTPRWQAGFGYEFMERADGFKGLAQTYGLRLAAPPKVMDLGLTYQALKSGQVDLIAGDMTNGLIASLDLFVLVDDRQYFPPYEAVPLVRTATLERYPAVSEVLAALAGRISADEMRRLNYAVDGEHREVKAVVREFLDQIEFK